MSVFSSSIGAVAYPAVSFSEGRRADRSQHGRLQPNRPLRATEGRQARRDRRDAHLEWIRRYIFPPNRAPLQADAFSSVFPVLSSQIEFDPKGSQARLFARDPPRAAVPNILIAKMRGGQVRGDRRGYPSDSDLRPQEIVAELHCNKGIGKEHAKWSPVGALSPTEVVKGPELIFLSSDRVLSPPPHHLNHVPHSPPPSSQVPGLLSRWCHRHFHQFHRRRQRKERHGQPRGSATPRIRGQGPARSCTRPLHLCVGLCLLVVCSRSLILSTVTIESAGQYAPEKLLPEALSVLLSKIREVRRSLSAYVG